MKIGRCVVVARLCVRSSACQPRQLWFDYDEPGHARSHARKLQDEGYEAVVIENAAAGAREADRPRHPQKAA